MIIELKANIRIKFKGRDLVNQLFDISDSAHTTLRPSPIAFSRLEDCVGALNLCVAKKPDLEGVFLKLINHFNYKPSSRFDTTRLLLIFHSNDLSSLIIRNIS